MYRLRKTGRYEKVTEKDNWDVSDILSLKPKGSHSQKIKGQQQWPLAVFMSTINCT